MTDYYSRPEVSNSALTQFRDMIFPSEYRETEDVYKMGTLLDCMITEPDKVNYFALTCDGHQYTPDEFDQAGQMKKSFQKDELCQAVFQAAEFQKVMTVPAMKFEYDVPFTLPVRCKWDFFLPQFGYGADLKTTTATSQKQFEEACRFFDYDRQRYFYMKIGGCMRDMIIGISKVNFQVFKFPIRQGDDFWTSGRDKCNELAFRYWLLFGELNGQVC